MPRLLLIFPMILWLTVADTMVAVDPTAPPSPTPFGWLSVWLGGFVALIIGIRLWSRRLAVVPQIKRGWLFLATVVASRAAIPAWFSVGLLAWGWGDLVFQGAHSIGLPRVRSALMLMGTVPAFATWIALWWATYPAERRLRQDQLLIDIEEDIPVRIVPPFRDYFFANLRLQVLATVLPIVLIVAVQDLMYAGMYWLQLPTGGNLEMLLLLGASLSIFLIAPLLMRYIFDTIPLADSDLRTELTQLAHRHRVGFNDILLWRTQHVMGNAAVMGVVKPLRFVLLSDLLLDSLSPRQVKAVFAHELGHAVHKHLPWYIMTLLSLATVLEFLAHPVAHQLKPLIGMVGAEVVTLLLFFAAFLMLFGALSRRFERQADVFAARSFSESGVVEAEGAEAFRGALERVAVINYMPLKSREDSTALQRTIAGMRNWLHGSMESRIDYLNWIAQDPARTARFDVRMGWLRVTLIGIVLTAVTLVSIDFISGAGV